MGTGWERKHLFGMPVDVGLRPEDALAKVANGNVSISYLNPFAWQVAKNDPYFVRNLDSMNLVHCDGVLVQRAVRSVFAIQTPIISLDFSGIGRAMLKLWSESGSTLCLVGATESVVDAARRRILADFPGIRVSGAFNGYGDSVSAARRHVLESAPEALLVGMGMGLQEAFLRELNETGWRGTGVCVGALFDRLANPKLDYPDWSTRHNVRFVANVLRRPVRYARRYGIEYLPFYRRCLDHLYGKGRSS